MSKNNNINLRGKNTSSKSNLRKKVEMLISVCTHHSGTWIFLSSKTCMNQSNTILIMYAITHKTNLQYVVLTQLQKKKQQQKSGLLFPSSLILENNALWKQKYFWDSAAQCTLPLLAPFPSKDNILLLYKNSK